MKRIIFILLLAIFIIGCAKEISKIPEEKKSEEIPPQAIVPLKKKTYNTIFFVLGAVLAVLLIVYALIKKKTS